MAVSGVDVHEHTALGIPLAALPVADDGSSAELAWTADAFGVAGRALIQPTGTTATYELALDRPMRLTAHARLIPHDWSAGSAGATVAIAAERPDGTREQLWRGAALSARAHGDLNGCAVECVVPGGTRALVLEATRAGRPGYGAVGRVMWVAPMLEDLDGHPGRVRPQHAAPAIAWIPGDRPLISVLTPVHDPPLHMLQECVDSVTMQTFPGWQLCLLDDGSRDPEVLAALAAYAAADPRIVLGRHDRAQGIARATNAALELADGTFVALLDHDDWLEPHALARIAERIAQVPDLDMLYTDEDIVMDGRRIWVHYKPAWSPDLLRTNGYTCHLGVYRTELMREIGGFRPEFDGSQDVDMILRLTERSDRVEHIPEILYHWRAHASSTAGGDAKPYAYVSAARAIDGQLERIGVPASVDYGPPGLYRVVHRVDPATTVALALGVDDADGLTALAASLTAQAHASFTLALAAPEAELEACLAALLLGGLDSDRVVTHASSASESLCAAASLRAAAETACATGAEHLLLLEAPVAGLTHDWLTRLIGYSGQSGIGAAGPVVLGPDGRVVHAGVGMPEGIPLHLLRGARTSMDELFGYGTCVYNVLALNGALATRRAVYEQLDGLDPELGALGMIDYGLRAVGSGMRLVTVGDARLGLLAPANANTDLTELRALYRRWADGPAADPYFPDGFRSDRGDFMPKVPLT